MELLQGKRLYRKIKKLNVNFYDYILYMSDEAWNVITNLKNKVTSLINTVASECRPDQPAVELAQKVLEKYITSDIKVDEVLQFLKVDMERTIA